MKLKRKKVRFDNALSEIEKAYKSAHVSIWRMQEFCLTKEDTVIGNQIISDIEWFANRLLDGLKNAEK